jgi:hypothetical protein
MADDSKPTLRLVSNRRRPSDFDSFDRVTQRPRYRQRALAPWQPKRKSPSDPMRQGEENAKLILGWGNAGVQSNV